MVFKPMSTKPNAKPITIWPSSNTGNELVRTIVVEPEPTKNRPNMSRYFGLIDLMRNPLRTTPSIPPMAEMMNKPPATSSETWVLLASRTSEADGSVPSMPIVIYVRPNVIKSRRRCERALLSMKHPFPLKYTAYESGCEMQRHEARAVCRKRMGDMASRCTASASNTENGRTP